MISSWEVYLVMQLDSVSMSLTVFTMFGMLIAALTILFNAMATDCLSSYATEEEVEQVKNNNANRATWRNRIIAVVLPLFFINMFIPSSKTAAAMIVIPAIANNETFRAEASDLYDLAKSGLKNLVAEEPKKDEH